MNDEALHRRLQRLKQRRRKPHLAVSSDTSPTRRSLPPGEEVGTPFGSAYRIETFFPLDHQHGLGRLSRLLEFESAFVAEVARQPELNEIPISKLVFIDTETTGLAGGAGTIAFLVGAGVFVEDTFRLRQYFLRDPAEEGGLLHALQDDLDAAAGFVSFNGRAFDLPLLEMRYMLGLRKHWPLNSWPQLDLLHPARRLWRRSLPDCTLGTIERCVMGVQRSEEDVHGALIPGMYLDYLRTGDATEMSRVVYHNAIDVLSLVELSAHILERHQRENLTLLNSGEALAIARWHHDAGCVEAAESAYLAALETEDAELQLEALRHYSAHLKRQDRRSEAVDHWKAWNQASPIDPQPCIELAMFYEWHATDLKEAHCWAREALLCLSHWRADWRRDQVWAEIEHRLVRLTKKMDDG